MRGADMLVAMRRAGYAPSRGVSIVVHDGPMPAPFCSGVDPDRTAEIEIAADESIGRLDLRCLIGMRVVVAKAPEFGEPTIGSADARIAAIVKAAIEAGAAAVIGLEYVRFDGAFHERRVSTFNPWNEPESPWQD